MHAKEFLNQIDDAKVIEAIQKAERSSSGEIQVYVARARVDDLYQSARKQFDKLQLHKTRDRNGVLIFIAPESRGFAIVGDEGIHSKGGDALWTSLAGEMEQSFHANDFTGGIVKIVNHVGEVLSRHFPRRNDDQNELPDTIHRE